MNITGTPNNDSLAGTSGDDRIEGLGGDDELTGEDGNDHLIGGPGNDRAQGNAGDDVLEGDDGNDQLFGDSGNDIMTGGAGNDLLDGGIGIDVMTGGAGDDIFIVDNAADSVVEATDGGIDEVRFGLVVYTLPANVEIGTSTATSASVINGNDLDNEITGTQFDDVIDGGVGADIMIGFQGDDRYFVDNAGDRIEQEDFASWGTDTVETGIAAYTLPTGVEIIIGNASQQILTGNAGDNVLTSNGGADTLIGGGGNDLYFISAGDLVVEQAGEGNDIVRTSLAYYALPDHVEELHATSLVIGQTLIGNAADNVILGTSISDQSDTIDGGAGADIMVGGHGSDIYYVDNVSDQVREQIDEGSADEVRTSVNLTLPHAVELLTGVGSTGLVLTGNHLANTIRGTSGNDVILANNSGGADLLIGGLGNDTYQIDAGDTIVEEADGGFDTVEVNFAYVLGANLEALRLMEGVYEGTGNELDNLLIGNGNGNILNGGAGADEMRGGASNDVYFVDNPGDVVVELAGEGEDEIRSSFAVTNLSSFQFVEKLTGISAVGQTLIGNDLNNIITGGSGNDVLDGGGGVDELRGGNGGDVYIIGANDYVYENGFGGSDEIRTTAAIYSIQSLYFIENLTGLSDAGQTLTGNEGVNVIVGGAGNDILDGYSGADTMRGGLGDDVYVVDNNSQTVIELAGAGSDEIRTWLSSFSLAGYANVEKLTGKSFSMTLTGNGLDNVITAGAYRDILDGGIGADTMIGGDDGDEYFVDNVGDVVVELAGPYSGTDTIVTTLAAYSLANVTNVENLSGDSSNQVLTGNAGNNDISGMNGNDILDGGLGADRMYGGDGDDIYMVDNAADLVVESVNWGTDGIRTALSTYSLAVWEEVENLTGTSASAQTLTGNAKANVIVAGAGNDTLDGASGADRLAGGLGNDLYHVDNAADVIVEAANAGIDTVRSMASYVLAANVENLLMLAEAVNGTGNGLANSITGTSGANRIDGAGGSDVMRGLGGNDTYVLDNAGDSIVEVAGGGTDTVESSISYTIGSEIERLTLTGTAVSGTGNELDNVITGNAGNNLLDGGLGSDLMAGGLGDDTYLIDNVGDSISEQSGAGTDTVRSSSDHTLGDWVENLVMLEGAVNGTGNGLANLMTGNGLANTLDGKGGVDNMAGGLGDDIYFVDIWSDLVTEGANGGTDSVQSAAASFTLGANVENLILLTGAFNGTGNGLANSITGNGLNNVLNGMGGADTMAGGTGHDTYHVDNAGDLVTEAVSAGNDTVLASTTYTLGDNVEYLTLTGTA
ncbi:MAG TPA: calcium-binding protein, partial [Allosphingosinicella sp.]